MARYYDRYYESFYPRSKPREAKGGIKAQTQRGVFGQSWWAKRWIAVLESFNIGARLGRGRSYARKGQVLSVDVESGRVTATVQGSRSTPYKITIKVQTLTGADWKKLADQLGKQALFTAKLLAGEMPRDIEDAFREAKLSLFPEKLRDLTTNCSCPDSSNPCKHIAAVYYLLGEEFDRDPFLLFKLRGMSRDELIPLLGTISPSAERKVCPEPEPPPAVPEPLPSDSDAFWNGRELPETFFGEVSVPRLSCALPKRLGKFPFWRGGRPLIADLEEIYSAASPDGVDVFLGKLDRCTTTSAAPDP